ncbi:hypothetical protein PHA51_01015 [Rodentibacter pneumotropicus]|uniref:hypothetical protein n=1 Tax=Rodentibacter pneumotropicus TaxID=758 RepID=UPI00233054F4|nr:hypothetical protein [Rodentibacter pneumotropicus]MDC2824620.1 hypothetical protein [Rodentibacter pneumotropicus]
MAISDINKMMAMYTQPTEFDQNAWKTAFDISNAFTNANNDRTLADENARKLRENLATEDWRTAYQKADFLDRKNLANWNVTTRDATQQGAIDATKAMNSYNTTQHDVGNKALLGQNELVELRAKFGKPGESQMEFYERLPEEVRKTVSPYAYYGFDNAVAQDRARKEALMQGVLQAAEKMSYDPITKERVRSGQYDSNLLDFGLNKLIASGAMNKEEAEALRKKVMHVDLAAYTIPKLDLSVPFGQLPQQPQQVASPYRLDAQPTNTIPPVNQPILAQPQMGQETSIEYVSKYGVSQPTLDLIQQQAALNNVGLQEMLRQNASRLALVKNGALSQEELNKYIQRDIDDARRKMAARAKAEEMMKNLDPNIFSDAHYIR